MDTIKKLFFFCAVILVYLPYYPLCHAADNITITTYFPPPFGVHKTMRLYPGPRPAEPCRIGEMTYDNGATPGVYTCNATRNWNLLGLGGAAAKYWGPYSEDPSTIRTTVGGSVAVGTSNPNPNNIGMGGIQQLYVVNSTGNPAITWGTPSAVFGQLGCNGSYAQVTATAGKNLSFGSCGNTEQVVINATGSVGIGTTNPQATLHASGSLLIQNLTNNTMGKAELTLRSASSSTHVWDDRWADITIGDGFWTNSFYPAGFTFNSGAFYEYVDKSNGGGYELGYINKTGFFGYANMVPVFILYPGWRIAIGARVPPGPPPQPPFALIVNGSVGPNTATCDLGSSALRWRTIYGTPDPPPFSDARMKANITDTPLGTEFVMRLRPVQFNWKAHDDGKHQGLIAQELEKVINETGIEFAGLQHDRKNDSYGISYTELIAPLVKAMQEQHRQLVDLAAKITNLTVRHKVVHGE